MSIAMVYPHISSEKGINKYSTDIIENVEKQGVKIDDITYIQGKPWSILKKLPSIRKHGVIHIQHEYNLHGYYGLPYFVMYTFLGFFKKKSLITTMHTVLAPKEKLESNRLKGNLRKLFYYLANAQIKWASDKVIAHSNIQAEILTRDFNFSKEKVVMLPHAIIENIKTSTKNQARKELKLPSKEPIYLMIGTMNPYHDYESVIEHAKEIGKKILIVTSTSAVNYRDTDKLQEALDSLKRKIKEKKAEKYVELRVGFVSYEDWWKYYAAADLILLPYVGGVGSGIFSDAMAMKKPVIASNVPYFTSIAKNTGAMKIAKTNKDFAKEIHNAMIQKNYKKLLQECNKYVAKNGLTPISKKYVKLYKELS